MGQANIFVTFIYFFLVKTCCTLHKNSPNGIGHEGYLSFITDNTWVGHCLENLR